MTPQGAFISADQITTSWLLNRSKTIHSYYKIIKLCADAIRELALTSLPLVKHQIITKPRNQDWFELPRDFIDYCSIGIRQGEYWRPIAVSTQLLPMPNRVHNGEYNNEYSSQFNTQGQWTNWINPVMKDMSGDFAGDDFFNNDFSNVNSPTPNGNCQGNYQWLYPFSYGGFPYFWSEHYDYYGENTGSYYGLGDGQRWDVATFNREKGILMVPHCFPCNHIYISYISFGTVDTMTYIDIRAQATIEAYITWKYFDNKRNEGAKAEKGKEEFYLQHKILRARLNDFSIVDLRRIVMKNYGQTQRIG